MTDAIRFDIGDCVRWTHRGTWREGVVTDVVLSGDVPDGVKAKQPRDHVSYLIHAQKINSRAQRYGSHATHWPPVELLRRV